MKFFNIFTNEFKLHFSKWKIIIPLAISLSFIISTGPWVQLYVVSAITSDATSIYDSVYADNYALFPNLFTWIKDGFNPAYLTISFLISFISLKWKTPKQILWISFLCSFILLSMLDFYNGVLNNDLNLSYIFQNLIGNFTGGILLSFVVILYLILYEASLNQIPTKKTLRYINSSILTVCIGIFSSTIIYYLALFFFKPLPVDIDIVLTPPITAAFANLDRKTDKLQNNSFKTINLSSANFHTSLEGLVPNVRWESKKPITLFDAEVGFYAGCFNSESIVGADKTLILKDITLLDLRSDSKHMNFITLKENKMSGHTFLKTDEIAHFWATKMTESPFIKLEQHLFNKNTLTYDLEGGNINYYLSGYLFETKNGQRKTSPRTISIQTNKGNIQLKFLPPTNIDLDEKIECVPIGYNKSTEENTIIIHSPSLSAGILVSINPQSKYEQFEIINPSSLVINNPNGFLRLTNINPIKTKQIHGNLNYLQFWNKASQIKINNKLVNPTHFDQYLIFGELVAYYQDGAEIRITGKGEIVTNGSVRMNLTKWENLDWNYRSIIIGIFSFLLYYLSKIILVRLNENRKLFFLS